MIREKVLHDNSCLRADRP